MTVAITLSAPMVPVDVDLRGMAFMPLDVVRLLDSDLFALSSGEEFKAALALWCKSWLQKPAASLPDDDRVLAHLSGTGTRWKKLKGMALRGWSLCADGRYYHPVIAEKALDAWRERVEYRDKRDNEAERQRKHREDHKALREKLRNYGVTVAYNTPMAALQEMLAYQNLQHSNTDDVTGTGASHETRRLWLREGQGERQREGEGEGLYKDQEHVLRGSAPEDEQLVNGLDGLNLKALADPDQFASAKNAAAGKLHRTTKLDPMIGFDQFYRVYPRKQKRADAEKAWRKLAPDEDLKTTIITALGHHSLLPDWRKDNGQYVPLPASWLNGRRWEDELETAAVSVAAQDIVDLYHEICVRFDPVTVLDPGLRSLLNERWIEHEVQQDLVFWREFFQTAEPLQAVFYRGQNRKPYLEAIVSRQIFRDIVEGRTHA